MPIGTPVHISSLHGEASCGACMLAARSCPRRPLRRRLGELCGGASPITLSSADCVFEIEDSPRLPTPSRRTVPLSLHLSDGWTRLQDRGRRPALDPLRRGRPRAPPVHARARAGGSGREGRPADEVALRRAARAAEPRRAHAAPGRRRAGDGDRSVAHSPAQRARARIPIGSRSGSSGSRRCCGSSPSRSGARSAFEALTRFLDALDDGRGRAAPSRRSIRSSLSFQLKLLWLSGYLPHLTSCAECGADGPLVGYSPRAGGAVCERCAADSLPLSAEGIRGIEGLLGAPLADAEISKRAAREALRVVTRRTSTTAAFACAP